MHATKRKYHLFDYTIVGKQHAAAVKTVMLMDGAEIFQRELHTFSLVMNWISEI
jgi:hypothetical protein